VRRSCWIALALVFCLYPLARAGVEVGSGDEKLWRFVVTGEITETDALFIESVIPVWEQAGRERGRTPAVMVNLDSDGGSVRAAMRIGRALRKLDALVRVSEAGKCMSSCVFVLAGAGRRGVYEGGQVGIHRPYMPEASKTTPDLERARYKALQAEVAAFLADSDIDLRLFRDMMLIPPDRIRVLTPQELEAYGLDDDAPHVQESDAKNEAVRLGISRAEYGRRTALANKRCKMGTTGDQYADLLPFLTCKESVLKTGR
jgi:hypothetical protein